MAIDRYVLDTSALIALIENEEGADQVSRLFQQADDELAILSISIVSCIELFYISLREQGQDTARERLELIKQLPAQIEPLHQNLIEVVGVLKANKSMSFADCCVAGLAQYQQAILVHKDPEFEPVEADIRQLKLPYKTKTT